MTRENPTAQSSAPWITRVPEEHERWHEQESFSYRLRVKEEKN